MYIVYNIAYTIYTRIGTIKIEFKAIFTQNSIILEKLKTLQTEH